MRIEELPMRPALAIAIAASVGAPAVDAAPIAMELVDLVIYTTGGESHASLGSSTATWSYDDVTTLLTQTGGTFNARFTIVPATTLYRHSITGLVIGNGAAATASSYVCTEGNFGGFVAASLCGNYNFGANFANESTLTYGPGTASNRTLGGDDVGLGPEQTIAGYDAFVPVSWDGTTLVLGNNVGGQLPAWELTLQAIPMDDADGDGVPDDADNCLLAANPGQCDSDGDGYGNMCDADLNNNGATNTQDYALFRQQLGQPSVGPTYNPADINCNGAVNNQDYGLFRGLLGSPPGPSGLRP